MTLATDDSDFTSTLTQAIRGIAKGIAPHKDGAESEEYRNVPIFLRNKAGLPADDVAAMLKLQRPELGIESENDLYEALARGQRQRRDAKAAPTKTESPAPTKSNNGFDVAAATEAVRAFAYDLHILEEDGYGEVLDQLRAAWTAAYLKAGHKALARYLLGGNVDQACKSFAKFGGAA